MVLPSKQERSEKKKNKKAEVENLKLAYADLIKSPAGKDLVKWITATMTNYVTRAFAEPNPNAKATLIDTAAGLNLVHQRISKTMQPVRSGGPGGTPGSSSGDSGNSGDKVDAAET